MTRLGVVDAVEAHYLALILDGLHQAGVLDALAAGSADAADLARRLHLNPALLEPLLDFAAFRFDLLTRESDGSYRLSGEPGARAFVEHMLNQYVGGYGPPLRHLASLLRNPAPGAELVDRSRHAAAFAAETEGASSDEALRLVLDFGATNILDLGCGGGQLLCDAAAANPELHGLGVDSNPEAAAIARARARRRGVDSRIEIVSGSALPILAQRNEKQRAGIQIVLASSVVNAYWAAPGSAADFLLELSRLLPGRVLIVSDYYSHLGRGIAPDAEARTLIHDIAQLVSGQGLPPASCEGWMAVYEEAGAELLHRFEARGNGIDRFIHIVKLAG